LDQLFQFFSDFFTEVRELDSNLILLVVLLSVAVLVLDRVRMVIVQLRKQSGFEKKTVTVAIDGSKEHPAKTYISDIQGLAGRPDGVIVEQGFFIPIERKPLSKKIRDRHVAQLLVYMRLIEEFEGKKPPYGYLILGRNSRKVKIYNSTKRQRWLQQKLDQMREILERKAMAIPSPHPRKCAKCSVRMVCHHRVDTQSAPNSSIDQKQIH